MQKFEFLRQPLLGELAMSRKKERRKKERENAIYSGHLRFCLQPRAAHALRSDQLFLISIWLFSKNANTANTWHMVSYGNLVFRLLLFIFTHKFMA